MDAISLMNYFPFWPTFTNLTEVLSHLMSVKFVVSGEGKRESFGRT